MAITAFDDCAKTLEREITELLNRAGLFFRTFSRGKSPISLDKKLTDPKKGYKEGVKYLQDAIGIRVILYFPEDMVIVERLLIEKYGEPHDRTIDQPDINEFSVSRYNLVYKIPDQYNDSVKSEIKNRAIDLTFEVQVRTVFSEGWHEIEHDLRYKRKQDWQDRDSESFSRKLNSIVAVLEINEWALESLFDNFAYVHYKNCKWESMIVYSLRLRFEEETDLEEKEKLNLLFEFFNRYKRLAKEFLHIDKGLFVRRLCQFHVPCKLNNIIYIYLYSICYDCQNAENIESNLLDEDLIMEIERMIPSFIKDKAKDIFTTLNNA